MVDLPIPLVDYFDQLLIGRLNPLLISTDASVQVTAWRGDTRRYGLSSLALGQDLLDPLPLLIGTLDALEEPSVLEFVAMPNGVIAHLHLLPLPGGFGLIFVEAGEDHDSRQRRQQVSHELALANEQKTKLLAQLECAQRDLRDSNQQLLEAGMLKTLFMGRMSHEFRTPLASILGHVNLASAGQGELDKHLRAIRGGGEYLLALVENLLDQARMDNNELSLQASETDLQELAEGIEAMFADQTSLKGFDFVLRTQDLPPAVWIDGTRLRQVLINLLGNALKFTERGSIELSMAWQDGRLAVSVTDTGPGIPATMQNKIFEPFSQVQGSDARRGAGLGLSISRSLVVMMGGELHLQASTASGSRFTFEVTADRYLGDVVDALSARLLVAEDDKDLQALLAVYLESAGYDLVFADDGSEAVVAVQTLQPDLILMDMQMPGLSGPQATAVMRRQGYRGPIVIMSAANEIADRLAADEAGSNAYLHKPVEPGLLLSTINSLLATTPA